MQKFLRVFEKTNFTSALGTNFLEFLILAIISKFKVIYTVKIDIQSNKDESNSQIWSFQNFLFCTFYSSLNLALNANWVAVEL